MKTLATFAILFFSLSSFAQTHVTAKAQDQKPDTVKIDLTQWQFDQLKQLEEEVRQRQEKISILYMSILDMNKVPQTKVLDMAIVPQNRKLYVLIKK